MDLSAQGRKRRAKDEREEDTDNHREISNKHSEGKKGKICATSILPPIPQEMSQNQTW